MNLKSKLAASTATPYWQDTRFGAPGLLRGFSIPRGPDDGGSGGGSDDDDDGDNDDKGDGNDSIDPRAHQALATAHERLKKDDKRRKQELADLKARLDQIEKEKEDAEHDAAAKGGDVEKVKTQLETRHAAEVKSLTERAEKAEAQVRALVINNDLSAALDQYRVKPELKKAATALLRGEGIELEEGDDGLPVAMKDGLTLAESVKLWAESEEGKAFVLEGSAGGGAQGGGKSSGRNPWKKETWSLSEQDATEAKNPGLAVRLKAEAGV